MWYQPTGDEMIRPTSLCSGTGITSGKQYLEPQMLNVFQLFGSYFNSVNHLFQDDDDDGDDDNKKDPGTSTKQHRGSVLTHKGSVLSNKNVRRSAFWVETIDEEEYGEYSSSSASDATSNDSVDSSSTDSDEGSDDDRDTLEMQKELIEKVIGDLRASQVMMSPMTMTSPGTKIKSTYKMTDKSDRSGASILSDNEFAWM